MLEPRENVAEMVRLSAYRWLQAIDLVRGSVFRGVADREYWAWKTKDFANGTWQGGIAGLVDAADLAAVPARDMAEVAEAAVAGTRLIQRSNGSFEEAYPWESSYAVTGLVLFDLLYAYFREPGIFSARARGDLEAVARGGLEFLDRTPETHGVIANHLATGELAILLAQKFLGNTLDPRPLERLLACQHEEGWFPEYGGADPGYQSLFNHYMFAGALVLPGIEGVERALRASVAFIANFALEDGSFAGEIGSRGTSILYPSGAWALEEGKPAWTALGAWAQTHYLPRPATVSPTTVDAGNFVPVFNAWALHARLAAEVPRLPELMLPFGDTATLRFPGAGLLVLRRPAAQAIVSLSNGAVRRCLRGENGSRDGSVVAYHDERGATSQIRRADVLEDSATILRLHLPLVDRAQPLNTPLRSSVLRAIGFLTYRFPFLQRALKRALAKFVMGRKGAVAADKVELTLRLDDPLLEPRWSSPGTPVTPARFGFLTHMASANSYDPRAL